jgi:CO/xanthine dehydrogenase Mo-binding subunit
MTDRDARHSSSPAPVGDLVGASVPRLEAREKITGRAIYTDDMTVPGMLHGALLGSPHPHARILSYDTSQARALPGVRAVLTAEDLPDVVLGSIVQDMPILARHKVRYRGEPVAAVAAVDLQTARRALELIQIQYEPLPAVYDAEEAMQPGAPVIHGDTQSVQPVAHPRSQLADQPNVATHIQIIEGDADNAWDECDVIVEGTYETPAQAHMYMEPCTTLAVPQPSGKITIWTSTQTVFRVQAITAQALAMPMSRVRVIAPRVGGGFGAKTEITNQPITAALARAAGAPVKLTFSRIEDTTMMKSRHPARIYMRTGATQDGRLRAREVRMYFDTGAYADDGPSVLAVATYFARGPYRIKYVNVDAYSVYTNKLRAAAFRGFGNPQITFASEVQIDELADRLGMDPIELRLRNVIETGQRWLGGKRVESGTMRQCLEQARVVSDWAARRQPQSPTPGKRRGIGIAAVPHVCALLGTSALVKLNEDGTVTVQCAAIDTGQGSETALVQCVSGALGLTPEQINFAGPDTDGSPYDFGTVGTRITFQLGKALTEACKQIKKQILKHASVLLDRSKRKLELRPGGRIGIKDESAPEVTFADVALRSLYVEGGPILGTYSALFPPHVFDPDRTYAHGLASMGNGYFVFAAQVAEVDVDELTGKVELVRAWSVHDVGRAINPVAAEGQIQGGFVQGLGYALFEEMVWSDGRLANPSMLDYKIPAAAEVPLEVHPVMLEHPSEEGPFGAKGVAEVGLVGVAPAISNAIRHATGVSLRRIPATSERVLRALLEQG